MAGQITVESQVSGIAKSLYPGVNHVLHKELEQFIMSAVQGFEAQLREYVKEKVTAEIKEYAELALSNTALEINVVFKES